MNKRAWWATVHGVSKNWTQLSMHACTHEDVISFDGLTRGGEPTIQYDSHPYKKGKFGHRDTCKENYTWRWRQRLTDQCAASQGTARMASGPADARRKAWNKCFLAAQKEPTLPVSWSWTWSPQNHETIHFHCLVTVSLQSNTPPGSDLEWPQPAAAWSKASLPDRRRRSGLRGKTLNPSH